MLIGGETRLVIFDWSGTLSDDRIPVYEANKLLLSSFGLPVPPISEFFKNGTGSLVSSMRQLGITPEIASDELIKSKSQEYFDEAISKGIVPTVYPQAARVLERIFYSKRKIVIVSTHPQHMLERESTEYGLRNKIHSIKGSLREKAFTLGNTCEELGVSCRNTLYVGDMEFDVRSAQEAQIPVIAISHGYHSREKLEKLNPLKVIDCLTELI